MKMVHEITKNDVGKNHVRLPDCKSCGHKGRVIWVSVFMGRIQHYDIGDCYQVENQEQLTKRMLASKRDRLGMFIQTPSE